MVTEDYIREAAVDDERIVIRPARDFALTLVDDRELAMCSIVARLQLPEARQLFLGYRRPDLATFPFDRVQSHWSPAFAGMTASTRAVGTWGGARAGPPS